MQTEELQKALKETVAKQEEEHRKKAEILSTQIESSKQEAEEERNERLKQAKASEEKAKQRKIDEQKAEQARLREEREAQLLLEKQQNEAEEILHVQREQAEKLEKELVQAQFLEEQARKSLEALSSTQESAEDVATGNPVEGTDGNTPETPLMSQHLRTILRQDNRNY